MPRLLLLALCQASLFTICFDAGRVNAEPEETIRIAPASGGVELDEIQIARRTALGAVKDADITNMSVSLWFTPQWKDQNFSSPYLIHLKELKPVTDDTGRVVSTERRLKDIDYLRAEARTNSWKSFKGKYGPVISLQLEAPARGANRIKSLRGQAIVTLTKEVTLTFKDLPALKGKDLDHPDMKSLREMEFRFSIRETGGGISAKLSAPVDFTSPSKLGRLHRWEVLDGEQNLRLESISRRINDEGVTEERTFHRETIKGLSLRLTVLEAVESKTFDFDFQNVELP